MINKNEVRLGNRLHYGGFEVEIIGIEDVPSLKGVDGRQVIRGLTWDQLEAIPLSEPLLELNGFTIYEDMEFRYLHRPSLALVPGINGWHMWQNTSPQLISESVRYLHQLQNLYYALTGIELMQPSTPLVFTKYRVGNVVLHNNEIVKIAEVHPACIVKNLGPGRVVLLEGEYEDLPADQETLLKLGMVEGHRINGEHGLLHLVNQDNGVVMQTIYNGCIGRPIQLVVDFQNLYYALTYKELN